MATSLNKCMSKFESRLKTADLCFDKITSNNQSARNKSLLRISQNDGLISYLWQSWGVFCKELIISSSLGTTTLTGKITSSNYSHLDVKQIITLAKLFSQGKKCPEVIQFSNEWSDATWGDTNNINLIVNGILPTNASILLSAFGTMHHIKSLKICRNSCAHINRHTLNEVKNLRVNYSKTDFRHPSDMMYWVDPKTGSLLWKTWIEEMKVAAFFATI